ncbi:hypothetical protein [Saccharothrix variisporea]|uniref:Uncharacterized protein n=1 Tax=Saccharothrix variisporea TaxID=543527 RepID=A0A495X7A1_9PSEU|nr:hypothetical protein [Saccharothrix variisporea]RKT69439.1 hypothetical protein DFJ66_2667 [Saccharothrix variisporea]
MADPSIWPNVVTAVATLGAGWGTVTLTLRHNNKRFALEQQDRIRADQRQAVVDLLHAGHEWVVEARAMLRYLPIEQDLQKVGDSPFMSAYNEKETEFRRRLVTARVVITEPGVAATVRALSGFYGEMPNLFHGIMNAERDPRGVPVPEPLAALWIVILQAEEKLQEIETAALERFSKPDPPPAPRRFLRRRKAAEPAAPKMLEQPPHEPDSSR